MDVGVLRQFLNFIQDFLDLCQWKEWPSAETSEAEIKNAFTKASHIQKCVDKLQKNNTLHEILEILNCSQESLELNAFIRICLTEPTKYILKKIINSNSKLSQLDCAFKIFLQLHSKEKLESCLTDLILEASSKEVLLKNLSTEISKDKLLKFKSEIFLSQITPESKECLHDMFNNCNRDSLEMLVVSLCSTKPKYQQSVNLISECTLEILQNRSCHNKKFWKLLFEVDDRYLINMCVENSDLYMYICTALIDCGKLLRDNMSTEYFYIDFTYPELVSISKKLFTNEFLKAQFLNAVNDHEIDKDFWQKML